MHRCRWRNRLLTRLPTQRSPWKALLRTRLPADKSCRIRTKYPQNNQAPRKPRPRKMANPSQRGIQLPTGKKDPIKPTPEGNPTSQITVPTHPNHGAQTNPPPMTQIPVPGDDPVFILRPSFFKDGRFFLPHPIFPIRPTENNGEGEKPSRFLSESAVIISPSGGGTVHIPRG